MFRVQNQAVKKADKKYIYTWNPDLKSFQNKSLNQKVTEFKIAVLNAQRDFQKATNGDPKAICIFVAPEKLFTKSGTTLYTHAENEELQFQLAELQPRLDTRMLAISGTIECLTRDSKEYKSTAYFVSHHMIRGYSKKEADGCRTYNGKQISMDAGTSTGVFDFHGLRIGLEICKDHEVGTLKNEMGNYPVDIHILISHGQNIRRHHITSSARLNGTFVICELEPEKLVDMNTSEASASYLVAEKNITVDPSRARFMHKLPVRSGSMELIKQNKTALDSHANISRSVHDHSINVHLQSRRRTELLAF